MYLWWLWNAGEVVVPVVEPQPLRLLVVVALVVSIQERPLLTV
jgi:hypothetical protein